MADWMVRSLCGGDTRRSGWLSCLVAFHVFLIPKRDAGWACRAMVLGHRADTSVKAAVDKRMR